MFRTEEFEVFVDPARDYPQIWRIILGVITAGVVYIVPILLLFVLAGFLFPDRVFEIQMALSEASTPLSMFVLLSTFFFMGLAAIAAAGVHRRGLASLIGPFRPACRNFSRAIVAVVVVYLAVGSVTAFFLEPSSVNLEPSYWLSLLPFALILLLVQTGSEELLFRGYLMQALAARFRSGWVWFVIPSLLFGAAHYNPAIDPRLNYAFLGAVTLFGFLAADLTRVTGNLGAAMGFHFANNFFALFLVSIEGEMSGLSLYHAAFTMEDVDTILPLVAIDVVTVLGVWWWLRRWLDPNRV